MGSFTNRSVAKLSKKCIENSELVMLRDEKTMNYVKMLGVSNFNKI